MRHSKYPLTAQHQVAGLLGPSTVLIDGVEQTVADNVDDSGQNDVELDIRKHGKDEATAN